ncbi:transcriptional regulator TetR family [Photobacterium aphoticum]|uniref:Transcriptional regulator TetR family n=1 Tax=Photobacterium aphoticum TaxID=754436 RepID=A0A090RBV5_9GAMM|nr:transcriptional regulator TetR family [Photobacterium aphoticum]
MTRSELKRLAIIDAAKAEFMQHGFLAANMDRISAAAEVSKRTLYRHFESKENLFEAVLTILHESTNQTVQYTFDPQRSLHAQLTDITYQEADILYHTYGIPLARTIVMEFLRQPDMANTLNKTLYSSKAIMQWFREAMAAGQLKNTDIKVISNVYLSLFQGALFWPQLMTIIPEAEGEVLKEKVELIVSVFLASFAVSPSQ